MAKWKMTIQVLNDGFQGFRLKNVVSRVEEVIAIATTQFSGRW